MRRIANGVRNYIRAAALSNGGNVTTIVQQVAVILAKYGTDAHVYLPGIGVINGLTAGNYLDSAGTTAATVDNPVGLVLDAAGSVGSEVIPQPLNFTSGWTTLGTLSTVTADSFTNTSGGAAGISRNIITGRTYKVSVTYTKSDASTLFGVYDGSAAGVLSTSTASSGTLTANYVATGPIYLRVGGNATITVNNISVKEVTGIHALQATTANKMILRRTNGRYWFDAVDGTDLLTTTYPAGYESVITIDAPSTGQVTLTAQNIVGTYNITTDTYGRFVFKTLTAGELAIMQRFANSLAGV
jgi:hypothetical protein